MVGACVSWPPGADTTLLPCGSMGKGEMPSSLPHPLSSVAGGRAGPGVVRAEDLAVSLTSCNTGEQALHLT